MADRIWTVEGTGANPIVAVAIHNGHSMREELAALCAVSESDRLREEDPYTHRWTQVAATRVVGLRSRFEVDLNRPRDGSVYIGPEDAWGMQVWKERPGAAILARSLAEHDAFYQEMERILRDVVNTSVGSLSLTCTPTTTAALDRTAPRPILRKIPK